MTHTLELPSAGNVIDEEESTVLGGKLAWSEVEDWDTTDLAPIEGEHPRDVVDEITDSHDFSEIITRFETIVAKQGLNIEPGGALQVWEDVLERIGPLSPEQEHISHQIVLDGLENVHNNLDVVAFATLFPVSKAVELLEGEDREKAIKTFTEVLDTVKTPVIATNMRGKQKPVERIDPSLVQASEEILEDIAVNPENAEDFEAELKRRATDVSIESLDKAIKRKKKKELFKRVATGRIFKELITYTSKKKAYERHQQDYEEAISNDERIRTNTDAFEVIEGVDIAQPLRPRMSLEELEAESEDDTDPDRMSEIDAYIKQQLKMASSL